MSDSRNRDQVLFEEDEKISGLTGSQRQRSYNHALPTSRTTSALNDKPDGSHTTMAALTGMPASARNQPFFKTRKGIIVIASALALVIAAIVGGGAGYALGKKSCNSNNNSDMNGTVPSGAPLQTPASSSGGTGIGTVASTQSQGTSVGIVPAPTSTPSSPNDGFTGPPTSTTPSSLGDGFAPGGGGGDTAPGL